MKNYGILLLGWWLFFSQCTTPIDSQSESTTLEITDLCQRCAPAIITEIKDNLATATTTELATFLCFYSPHCKWEDDKELHAILIKSFALRSTELIAILDGEADLHRDFILNLLRRPATQYLPQRTILEQLEARPMITPMGQQVLVAFQESVRTGNAALLKVANDKSHTYQ